TLTHLIFFAKQVQEDLNKKMLDGLLEFVKKSAASFWCRDDDWMSRMRASEIPTAALVLGVNMPDHTITFESMTELLHDSLTPFVASVQAKECTAMKQLMQKVLQRLMGTNVMVDEDEAEADLGFHTRDCPQKRVNCSLSALCDWYQSATKKSPVKSPRKRLSSSQSEFLQSPPVVVIFRDLEAFSPQVLQDFILVCSQYVHQLPLVFIFGIATSPSTIQRMLPHSVSSLLCIELFQSLSCTQHLATIIDKLFLTSKFHFKFSAKVLQVLVGIFLYHDFSVCNFIKGLQLSLLEHFHSQPLSVLCCHKQEALVHAQQLNDRDVERIQQLPSFMRYVEEQVPEEQVQLLTSSEHVKGVCQKLLKSLHKYHKNFYPALRCLHVLTSILPKYPLGKQIRELYVLCLEKKVWETQEYDSAMQLIRMLAKDELVTCLQKCVEILTFCKSKKLKKVGQQLEGSAENRPVPPSEGNTLEVDHHALLLHPFCVPAKYTLYASTIKCINHLHHPYSSFNYSFQTLLEMKECRRTRRKTPYEILRNAVVDYIDNLVKTHLYPPESQPLYEVWYYSSSGTVRRHLNATPRTSIQTALSHPYCYLQNDSGIISSAAPDICIIYKLHLECGRLINLYDWLEAYATVATAAEGKDPSAIEGGKVDELKHARFIRAVSELEFLGFVKSTKQKTDHVARLTWGGC
uniref:Origin recognition complex subunit 3 n=1 Tax=Scleropages formosus TaxID=113540 RepID=A0A8C9TTL2_SCLFO